MKKLKDIIEGLKIGKTSFMLEKLKINSKTKVHKSDNILDKDIKDIYELHDVLEEYFDKSSFNATCSKISELTRKWKTQFGNDTITVDTNFSINFFEDGKLSNKLQVAEFKGGEYLLMQLLVKDYKGRMQPCRIHGGSTYNQFKPGDNLLNFIQTIIKHTEENHPVDRDPNIIKLFKEL